MSVVCRMLSVVWPLLSVACCCLCRVFRCVTFDVCRLPLVGCCLSFLCRLLSVGVLSSLLSVGRCVLIVVCCLLYIVYCMLFIVCGLLVVGCY